MKQNDADHTAWDKANIAIKNSNDTTTGISAPWKGADKTSPEPHSEPEEIVEVMVHTDAGVTPTVAPPSAWDGADVTSPDSAIHSVYVPKRVSTHATQPPFSDLRPGSQAEISTNASTTAHSGATTGLRAAVESDESWYKEGRIGPHTGQRWGDFDLGGMLGEGGMGAVYRARQRSLKRRVAIKVLSPNFSRNPKLVARFKLEATIVSRIQSPHVVQVYAIGEEQGNHYFAMEFVDGIDLAEYIRLRKNDNQAFTVDEAADFILQAARGLTEAGRLGIVHRDIKPHNLMLNKDGVVKIADFGVVKVIGEQHLTLTGQTIGTPAYFSPEQGRGERDVDGRSDIYSLGVVFYELACGKKPFSGATPSTLIFQHSYKEPELPRSINPKISDEHQAIILRCLQKKAANRYQSAQELAADLDAIRAGAMLQSALASYRLATGALEARREQMSWLQRNILPLSAAAFLALGIAGIGAWRWNDTTRRNEFAATQDSSRLRQSLAASLDNIAPLPNEVDASLDRLTAVAAQHDHDADVMKWRQKVREVHELEKLLTGLDRESVTASDRITAKNNLTALMVKVGNGDTKVVRWQEKLNSLDTREKNLRAECARIDSLALHQGDILRFTPLLDQLALLVPNNDTQLTAWRNRFAEFSTQVAMRLSRISPLDTETNLTSAKRAEYTKALDDIRPYLDETDENIQRWNNALSGVQKRIDSLHDTIVAVIGTQPERVGKPKYDQIASKLDDYRVLCGSDNAQLKDWLSAIASGERTAKSAREHLDTVLKDTGHDIIHAGILAAVERDIAELAPLTYPDDATLIAAQSKVAETQKTLADLTKDIQPLFATNDSPLSLTQQSKLSVSLNRLNTKGGMTSERVVIAQARLANEQKRIATLREQLASLNKPASVTAAHRTSLKRLTMDVDAHDTEVQGWNTKVENIDKLVQILGALDRREGLPEDIDARLKSLAALVGEQDPQVIAWSITAKRIRELRSTLAPLDAMVSFEAATMARNLADLTNLAGSKDRQCAIWKAKLERVASLKNKLAPLATAITLSKNDHAAAHDALRILVTELIGTNDTQVREAAVRLAELDGPNKPTWASAIDRDAQGLFVQAGLPGGSLRLRWVASGTVTVGSPNSEPGHEDDEFQVALTLPKGFWIADVETPRSIWTAVMGNDPSWSRMSDASVQPAERMSWNEAVTFTKALTKAVPGFSARLPLEAEWEYACRAGSTTPWFLAKDDIPNVDTVSKLAWHNGNTGEDAQPSRNRRPNPLGIYDMHGNLAEWCADSYGPYPTTPSVITQPATGMERRVLRGGSWGDHWLKTRAANRTSAPPEIHSAYIGCRLVVDANTGETGPALLARLNAASTLFARFDVDAVFAVDRTPRLYRIVASDTLTRIAQDRYHDVKAWRLIVAANPWLDPAKTLPVNTWLTLPPQGSTAYVIRQGDTLTSITASNAKSGTGSLKDLITANPWLDTTKPLPVGRMLVIPAP